MEKDKNKVKFKDRKRPIRILICILIIFILILIYILAFLVNNSEEEKSASEMLEYINSDDLSELEEGTFSPDLIHVVIAAYDGELPPVSISKSTYYFTTEVIPDILKNCKNDSKTEQYYNENKDTITTDLGINTLEKFKLVVAEIQKLDGDLVYESSKFDTNSIEKNTTGLYVNLIIKYENNDEIEFKVFIKNKVYSEKTSIYYSVVE